MILKTISIKVRLRLACYYLLNEENVCARRKSSNWGLSLSLNFGDHMKYVCNYKGPECWLNIWDVDSLAHLFQVTIQLLYPYINGTEIYDNDALDCTYRFNANSGNPKKNCILLYLPNFIPAKFL